MLLNILTQIGNILKYYTVKALKEICISDIFAITHNLIGKAISHQNLMQKLLCINNKKIFTKNLLVLCCITFIITTTKVYVYYS